MSVDCGFSPHMSDAGDASVTPESVDGPVSVDDPVNVIGPSSVTKSIVAGGASADSSGPLSSLKSSGARSRTALPRDADAAATDAAAAAPIGAARVAAPGDRESRDGAGW